MGIGHTAMTVILERQEGTETAMQGETVLCQQRSEQYCGLVRDADIHDYHQKLGGGRGNSTQNVRGRVALWTLSCQTSRS